MVKRIFVLYQQQLIKNPLKTKMLTNMSLLIAGDLISQKVLEEANKPFNYKRSCQMARYANNTIGLHLLSLLINLKYSFV